MKVAGALDFIGIACLILPDKFGFYDFAVFSQISPAVLSMRKCLTSGETFLFY